MGGGASVLNWREFPFNGELETKLDHMFWAIRENIPVFGPAPYELVPAAAQRGSSVPGGDVDVPCRDFSARTQNERLCDVLGVRLAPNKLINGGDPCCADQPCHWRCWRSTGIFPGDPNSQCNQIACLIETQFSLGCQDRNVSALSGDGSFVNIFCYVFQLRGIDGNKEGKQREQRVSNFDIGQKFSEPLPKSLWRLGLMGEFRSLITYHTQPPDTVTCIEGVDIMVWFLLLLAACSP